MIKKQVSKYLSQQGIEHILEMVGKKSFGFKNVKRTEVASAKLEAADEFPGAIKKIIEKKGYLPECILNADKNGLNRKN